MTDSRWVRDRGTSTRWLAIHSLIGHRMAPSVLPTARRFTPTFPSLHFSSLPPPITLYTKGNATTLAGTSSCDLISWSPPTGISWCGEDGGLGSRGGGRGAVRAALPGPAVRAPGLPPSRGLRRLPHQRQGHLRPHPHLLRSLHHPHPRAPSPHLHRIGY
jgi:hypothetical protein